MANEEPTSRSARPGYEFSTEENQVIAQLATQLHRAGIVVVVGGVLLALYLVVQWLKLKSNVPASEMVLFSLDLVLWLVMALLLVATGIALSRANQPFVAIVKTSGSDVPLLMTGLAALSSILKRVFVVVIPCLVLLLASLTLLIVSILILR